MVEDIRQKPTKVKNLKLARGLQLADSEIKLSFNCPNGFDGFKVDGRPNKGEFIVDRTPRNGLMLWQSFEPAD